MTADDIGILIVRVMSLIFGVTLLTWPLLAAGKAGILPYVLAAPFFIAALAPRTLGPHIGKGIAGIASLMAMYDPPSSIGFFPDRWLFALPFLSIGALLAAPQLSQALARSLFRQ